MPLPLDATRHVRVPMTDEQRRAEVVSSKGFTHGQLHDAFTFVQDKTNWKNPIACVLDDPTDAQCQLIAEAVNYIAGGGAKFTIISMRSNKIRVTAPGYYNTIGA
jgi:hypothetical protein